MQEFKKELHYSLKYYGMIQKKINKLLPFDIEYIKEVYRRLEKGGILWLIERTDTNEFLIEEQINIANGCFGPYPGSIPSTRDIWTRQIPTKMSLQYTTAHYFLTKEDAEHGIRHSYSEGGCRHCGHGSKKIPTIITEHEFVAQDFKKKFQKKN